MAPDVWEVRCLALAAPSALCPVYRRADAAIFHGSLACRRQLQRSYPVVSTRMWLVSLPVCWTLSYATLLRLVSLHDPSSEDASMQTLLHASRCCVAMVIALLGCLVCLGHAAEPFSSARVAVDFS